MSKNRAVDVTYVGVFHKLPSEIILQHLNFGNCTRTVYCIAWFFSLESHAQKPNRI